MSGPARSRGDLAVCLVPWFDGHNNPRYVELFPRLSDCVRFLRVPMGRRRVVRAAAFRVWHALKPAVTYPLVLPWLARSHRTLFAVDPEQAPSWPRAKSVVVDVDDAVFSERELGLLSRPQVKAVVVTTERARDVFLGIGLKKPIHVVPQGVSTDKLDRARSREIAEGLKAPGAIVAGYHAPTLTMAADGDGRPRDGLDDLDFLFAEFEAARRSEPRLSLWLVGRPSAAVGAYAAGKPWIRLFGYVPFDRVLDHVACFDVAVYPRTYSLPPGRFSVKVAQYLALGVPVVSTPVEESFAVRESGGGVVAGAGEFREALAALGALPGRRSELGAAGRRFAFERLEWSHLVRRYREILE